jgi:uncharacterized membrane protein
MQVNFKKIIDKSFEIAILVKSFFGVFEILAGILLAISGKIMINNLIIALTQQEISEDPSDFFANYLAKALSNISAGSSHIFAVVYLLFHGIVNIFLAIALLKNKIWAYFWAVAAFGLFIIYQVYRYFHTYSPLLLVLIAFDALIILLILLEYRNKKQK